MYLLDSQNYGNFHSYPSRSRWIQSLCPAPKRHLQYLITTYGLKSGIDIGCGGGSPLTSLRNTGFVSTGIDISPECIKNSRQQNTHDEYICGDFRTFQFEKQYDVVVISHVLEHFTRDEGMDVIRRIESMAKRLIYIETPHSFLEQTDFDGNLFQRHLSGWFPHDFQNRGYTVFGSGPRGLTGPMGKSLFFSDTIIKLIGRCFQWYFFRRPDKAKTISAIRYIDESGNVRQL